MSPWGCVLQSNWKERLAVDPNPALQSLWRVQTGNLNQDPVQSLALDNGFGGAVRDQYVCAQLPTIAGAHAQCATQPLRR